MVYFNAPSFKDKIFCSLMYLGCLFPLFVFYPFIWLIIANLKKIPTKDFVKYHIYQAILFNMIAFFLPEIFQVLVNIFSGILDFFTIFGNTVSLLGSFKNFVIGIYFILIKAIALYGIIWTFRGKYTYIPPVSQAVNLLLR
jgi:hypothetical protein